MGSCISVEIDEGKAPTGHKGSSVSPGSNHHDSGKPKNSGKHSDNHKKHSGSHDAGSNSGKKHSGKQSPARSDGGGGKNKNSINTKGASANMNMEEFVLPESDNPSGLPGAKRMKLKELQLATNNFDESLVLGEGSFGKVYKGYLDEVRGEGGGSGTITKIELAVKKLNPQSFQGYDEWLAEVLFLDKLRHPNLVRLVGYCAEAGEALLAYELCPHGSLDQAFFDENAVDLFTWELRVKVALDAAQGLAYLHEMNVIHRDFKPSNILLGKDMVACLTDFGMAKEGPEGGESHISTRVMGTLGYLDPAYMQTGRLTRKSDTYSYGVMLLELLTGKRSQDENLTKWARPLLAQRRPDVQQLIDPRLEDKYSKTAATKIAILAKHCVDDDPVSRPEMKVLVESLKRIVKEQEA